VPSDVGIFLLRLLLRFRRSLSKTISKQCRGGPRAQCCWDCFAETSAAISQKSQQTNSKHGRGGPRARCCWNLFAETSPEISGKSQEKIRKQCRGGPRARCCRDCFVDSSAAISEKSRQQNQQTVQRRSPHAVMLGLFLLRLLLRFRRSLSKRLSKQCRGGPRGRCCWDLFADTCAAVSEKSQQPPRQAVPRRSPCPVLLIFFAETSAVISEKSQQKISKQCHVGPRTL